MRLRDHVEYYRPHTCNVQQALFHNFLTLSEIFLGQCHIFSG